MSIRAVKTFESWQFRKCPGGQACVLINNMFFDIQAAASFGQILIGGAWKTISAIQVLSGTWKPATAIKVLVGGAWK